MEFSNSFLCPFVRGTVVTAEVEVPGELQAVRCRRYDDIMGGGCSGRTQPDFDSLLFNPEQELKGGPIFQPCGYVERGSKGNQARQELAGKCLLNISPTQLAVANALMRGAREESK